MTGLVATAEIDIDAAPAQVWAALVDPVQIKKFMFGSDVETDWRVGSPIVWRGVHEGRAYEDKGEIVAIEPGERLVVTHYSPMSGQPDVPENYHTLTYQLEGRGAGTHLTLSQDNNATPDEAEHSTGMWTALLDGVKKTVEAG
ncbi:SRPBCC domain-containing protein [Blastococcus sp. CT_GayMR16]|uniref:SRPBCC domain-containing protein n=1 Tax=Blastococcus sp. CT_GayMR16 TaxID=2559607 RepID=UPI0010736A64|nr:SRPBCC domain-containing protein [Blastococcus sp. CT_GayMR16]TFV91065.1 SRPBCC domain-containing protein [Blastococcus sp. CT_GayMR16]